MVTAQPAQRDGASLLLSLTRDPARIEARIRQAALLEAADVPAPLVRALVKITTTGRLTHEDIHVMRDTGIDIDGMVTAIQRANHTLRTTQDHATAPQAHPMTTPPPYEIRYATPADGTAELDEVIARNYTGATPTHAPNRDAMRGRSAEQATDGHREGRDDSRPAERRWRIRRYGAMWRATDPNCRGQGEDGCRITATWTDAIDHVNNELRNRALAAIENQEATNQPQEDQ